MDGYRVLIKPSAVKELETVSLRDRQRMVARVNSLAEDPRPAGCERLSGEDKFRLRQGDYRVVYLVDDGAREVTVFRIGHRRDVYR